MLTSSRRPRVEFPRSLSPLTRVVVLVPVAALGRDAVAVQGLRDHGPLRQDLDQVAVRVFHERKAFHASAVRRLRERAAQLLEPLAGLVDVRHRDAQVAEPALHGLAVLRARRVGVARVVDRAVALLRAVVPGQFDAARRPHAEVPARVLVRGDRSRQAVRHEVDREAPLREVAEHDQLEAERLDVKLERRRGVLHPNHRLLHAKVLRLRRLGRRVERRRVVERRRRHPHTTSERRRALQERAGRSRAHHSREGEGALHICLRRCPLVADCSPCGLLDEALSTVLVVGARADLMRCRKEVLQ